MAQQAPWEMDWGQGPSAPSGAVYGPAPKPDKPPEPKTSWRMLPPDEVARRGLPPGAYQESSEGKVDPMIGGNGKPATTPEMMEAGRADAKAKLDIIKRLDAGSNSWFGTGFGAETMSEWGGSNAANVKADIGTLGSAGALVKIIEMARDNGGKNPLAPMSQGDVETIAKSISNLALTQGDENFRKNLNVYRDIYRRAYEATGGNLDDLDDKPEEGVNIGPDGNPISIDVTDDSPPSDGGPSTPFSERKFLGMRMGDSTDFAAGIGDIVAGVADIPGIIGNPLNQGINAVFGTNLSTNLGQSARDLTGLPQNRSPLAAAITRGGAGALAGGGMARGLSGLVQSAPVRNALATLGRSPVRDTLAGAGAGGGAELAREQGAGSVGQIAAAVGGGLLAHSAAGGVNSLATRTAPNALAQAAFRQGVDMLPADAGGTAPKILTSGAKASPLSSGFIRSAARKNIDQLKAASDRVIAGQGGAVTSDQAGTAVREAGKRMVDTSRNRGEQLYTRAYKAAAGVKTVKPLRTVAAIDEQIARLKNEPTDEAATMVKELKTFRDKIAGGVSIQGLRDARTRLSSGVYDGKLRSNPAQSMFKNVLANVSEDIDGGLRASGKSHAADMFKKADAFWKGRVEHIDQVLQPILGKDGVKSGEEIVTAIESMARGKSGGNARLSRLLGEMTTEEAGNVRATIIDRMGKAKPGQQDNTGEVFAPSTFLTNWNTMTPQAKASLFSSQQMRRDLDDIAELASGMRETEKMSNFSNTAMAATGGGNAVGAYFLATLLHPAAAVGIAGTQLLTGKLLASPGFARVLARTAKMPPQASARSLKEQLGVLGTREPLLRGDLTKLIQKMQETVANSPGRAAADEKEPN